MARVSVNEVTEVIAAASRIGHGTVLHSFIDTANLLVDTHLLNVGHSEGVLTKIELYLAAHLVAITSEVAGMTRDKFGQSEMEWANTFVAGIGSSNFGQVALALDTSGKLAELSRPNLKAQFRLVKSNCENEYQ